MNIKILQEKDKPCLIKILNYFNLITQDIDFNNHIYIGLKYRDEIAAAGGLELHPPYALLRSVAVSPAHQGNGYAKIICDALTAQASDRSIQELYLLTETARGYFSKLGFTSVDRRYAPEQIQQTSQFSSLCPADAVIMQKLLTP